MESECVVFDTPIRPRQDRATMTSERIQRQIERLLDEAADAISGDDWPSGSQEYGYPGSRAGCSAFFDKA